jgi:hypothetical protein
MTEPSASAVLAFLVVAPAAPMAAEELLFPMSLVRGESCGSGVGGEGNFCGARGGRRWRRSGKHCYLSSAILFGSYG